MYSGKLSVRLEPFAAGLRDHRYSGLNLLSNFQPDQIKLDMSLIRGIERHGPRQAIARAIGHVCFELGIDVIAEGVETLEEYGWLAKAGVRLFQGYLFAKPAFEAFPPVHYPQDTSSTSDGFSLLLQTSLFGFRHSTEAAH